MSSFEIGSPRVTVQVQPGNNVARIPALKSGTLYAVLLRGKYGDRYTSIIQPSSAGVAMGQVPFDTLPAEVQTAITNLQSETNVSYPNGYFVAGGSANVIRNTPTWFVDTTSSKDTLAVVRVAVPDFNSPVPSYLAGIRMRVSTDSGDTYRHYQDVSAPFEGNTNYATFQIPVPYEQTVLVKFQAIYKDGTFGRETRPVKFSGVAKPADPPAAAPILESVAGTFVYSAQNDKLQLRVTVTAIPDPTASALLVQLVDGTGKVRASQEVPNSLPGTALSVVLEDVDPTVSTYTVNAYSNVVGKLSKETSTTWDVSSATGYAPAKFDPAKVFLSEEIYRMGDGTLESRIRVKFEGALDAERTRGAVYLRRRDTYGGDLTTFGGFSKVGVATGNFLTDAVVAGATVAWDVVVLAVGKDGTEASFSSDQIKTVSVVQYANYVPPMQSALPTVLVTGEDSLSISGTYTRAPGTPEPVKLRAYKSETSTLAADLVAEAIYVYLGNGVYGYTLTLPSISVFAVGSNNYDITLRTLLENQGLTPTAGKTTVRVVRALPTAPILSSVTPYAKTVKAVVAGFSALSASAQSNYTPAGGGNGTTLTITPEKSALVVEVSDSGTPGTNPELVNNASIDPSTGVVTFTPATNSGTRNVRVAWKTSFGNSAWSTAREITFPAYNVVDSTVPDLTPCAPRFVQNSDGSITISWTSATFGASGLGNYVIRRNSTNNSTTSVVVGTVTTATNLTWTDFIDQSRIGQTFYYWLEAVSAQGVKSAAPIPVKKASANSYAVETVVAAVSTDSAPADVTGLAVKGAQGGFEVRWTPVSDRDIKDYQLEFSALGTFTDTVTTYVSGSTYFQTLGATAPKATADAYRWRLKARDFGGNLSANYSATATPDNTNYGFVQDTAPNAPQAVTLTNNTDGSITLTITAPASNAGTYYRIVRRYKTTAGWTETDATAVVENDIQIPSTAATFRDTGLLPGRYYNYRVYSRSKLGTESASYAAAASAVAATDTTAPPAPALAVTPQYGVSSVTVTPQEANGTIELWCNEGTTTWNAGTAKKIGSAVVGPAANAVSFAIGELDGANPVNKVYAARHIDAWGNASTWSTPASAMSLNFLRAEMIDATHVKAGSMTVDKLVVGAVQRQSLVSNGHFGSYNTYGDSTSGWTLGAGVSTQTGYYSYTPLGSTTAIPVMCFNLTAASGLLAEQYITVLPGATYTVVGVIRAGATVAPKPAISLRVMDASGTTRLSSASNNPSAGSVLPDFYKGGGITAPQTNNSDTVPAGGDGGWQLIAYKVTIPTGYTDRQVRLQIFNENYTGGGYVAVAAGFIQMYSDTLSEASIGADQVNQLKAVAYGGDVSGTYDALTVRGLQGRTIAGTTPSHAQVLGWHSTNNQWQSLSISQWLGYTPANKAGEAFTGDVTTTGLLGTSKNLDITSNPTVANTALVMFGWNRSGGDGEADIIAGGGSGYSTLRVFRRNSDGTTTQHLRVGPDSAFSGELAAAQFNGSGAGLTGTAPNLTAGAVAWTGVTGKPTTLSGFGITDAVPRAGGVYLDGMLGRRYNSFRTLRDVAGFSSATPAATGTIKIKLPVAMNTATMLSLRVRIHEYSLDRLGTTEFFIYGYNYSTWTRCAVTKIGDSLINTVRFGTDGTKACILLGTTGTVLSFPKIEVTEVMVGHTFTESDWLTGWEITQITDESGITIHETPPVKTMIHSGTIASQSVANAVTAGGKAPSNSVAANTLVTRDENRYSYFHYINSNTSNSENPAISQVIVTNGSDHFYRKASLAHLVASMDLSGKTAGNATMFNGNTSNNAMLNRGYVAEASLDTATGNGFYTVQRAGDSIALLCFNAGGSTGPLQLRFDYLGNYQIRNKTDSTTWTAWKSLWHSGNFDPNTKLNTSGGVISGELTVTSLKRTGNNWFDIGAVDTGGAIRMRSNASQYFQNADGTINRLVLSDSAATLPGSLYLVDGNTALRRGHCYTLNIVTPSGDVHVGSQNASWCHFITDRPGFYFNQEISAVTGFRLYSTNTTINSLGFNTQAGNGQGYRFWNGSDGYSITMNDYNGAMGAGGYNTGGADYNMSFRMDGDDEHRGGSDHVARGFMFRNGSFSTHPYAQLAPFGNHSYWGGIFIMRDCGNNNLYGLYFLNGVLYAKQMA